jgi:hypothetical protein
MSALDTRVILFPDGARGTAAARILWVACEEQAPPAARIVESPPHDAVEQKSRLPLMSDSVARVPHVHP